MARTYKQKSIVSGMSVQDILNLDNETFNKLGISDMRKVVGRLVSVGNKRLRTFEKRGETSPATRYIMQKSGGMFSTRGKNLNQLRAEYVRAKSFLQAKTGTIKGWKNVKEKTLAKLKTTYRIDITPEQFDDFWKAYEDLKELDPEVSNKKFKYTALKEIEAYVKDGKLSPDEIALKIHSQLSTIYEQKAGQEHESSISDFFDL